jgi:hypothetical protein
MKGTATAQRFVHSRKREMQRKKKGWKKTRHRESNSCQPLPVDLSTPRHQQNIAMPHGTSSKRRMTQLSEKTASQSMKSKRKNRERRTRVMQRISQHTVTGTGKMAFRRSTS